MFKFITDYFDRLAMSRLTRDDTRVMILGKNDNALLIRDGMFVPTFSRPPVEGSSGADNAPGICGALWLASILRVVSDDTGDTSLATALLNTMIGCGMSADAIEAMLGQFQSARVGAGTDTHPALNEASIIANSITAEATSAGSIAVDKVEVAQ